MDKLILNKRTGSKINMRDPQKPSAKSSLTRHIDLYNALPFEWKTLKIPVLKRRLRKMKVTVTI